MKKKILLLSAAGAAVAAGFVYALEANRRKQNNGDSKGSAELQSSENERATEAVSADTERAGSMARLDNGNAVSGQESEPEIDDQGTGQFEASQILKDIRDTAFDSSNEKLALALGRPTEEIEEWTSGSGLIDGDVVMKARALAIQRGIAE